MITFLFIKDKMNSNSYKIEVKKNHTIAELDSDFDDEDGESNQDYQSDGDDNMEMDADADGGNVGGEAAATGDKNSTLSRTRDNRWTISDIVRLIDLCKKYPRKTRSIANIYFNKGFSKKYPNKSFSGDRCIFKIKNIKCVENKINKVPGTMNAILNCRTAAQVEQILQLCPLEKIYRAQTGLDGITINSILKMLSVAEIILPSLIGTDFRKSQKYYIKKRKELKNTMGLTKEFISRVGMFNRYYDDVMTSPSGKAHFAWLKAIVDSINWDKNRMFFIYNIPDHDFDTDLQYAACFGKAIEEGYPAYTAARKAIEDHIAAEILFIRTVNDL